MDAFPHADGQTSPEAIRSIRRTLTCVCLFCAALTGLLAASRVVLLPRLTGVHVNGVHHDVPALRREHTRLAAQVSQAEQERRRQMLPVHDPHYRGLVAQKHAEPAFAALLAAVQHVRDRFAGDTGHAVFVEEATLRAEGSSEYVLELRGEVRNVGVRSMTVLVQFVDALAALPAVRLVESPVFRRESRGSEEFFSPFYLRVLLQ